MTAYEMRMSDWSSDVCSSDLGAWNGIVTRADLPKRRFLALWFPWLSTDRLRLEEHDGGHPLALVDTPRGAMRLTACHAAAPALGLAPGLPLADARVRVPDLSVAGAEPAADARSEERGVGKGAVST